MSALPRLNRPFHLSIASRGLAPSTLEAAPVSVRGFFLVGSRHTAGARGARKADALITQQVTLRITYRLPSYVTEDVAIAGLDQKIWDDMQYVTIGHDANSPKISAEFKGVQEHIVTVESNFVRVKDDK
jgi:hypothetical protein